MSGRVVVITGTRAEFGLLERAIEGLRSSSRCHADVVVAGMHLVDELGGSVRIVEQRFPVAARVPMHPPEDSTRGMGLAVAEGLRGFLEVLDPDADDLVLVLGDRTEAFAAALAAAYLGIPLAHIHGGDLTGNAIDDFQRDAISRIAILHLAATEKSARRLRDLGVGGRVAVVGAPGLDAIVHGESRDRTSTARALGLPEDGWVVTLHHPVQLGGDAEAEMREVLDAVARIGASTGRFPVAIFPNNDAGHRAVIEELRAREDRGELILFRNLSRVDYLDLLRHATVLVGNSSSGIIESASLGLPVVNVGARQRGRERNDNVVDAPPLADEIVRAADRALGDSRVLDATTSRRNLYGDGRASERIVAEIEALLGGGAGDEEPAVEEAEAVGAAGEPRP